MSIRIARYVPITAGVGGATVGSGGNPTPPPQPPAPPLAGTQGVYMGLLAGISYATLPGST